MLTRYRVKACHPAWFHTQHGTLNSPKPNVLRIAVLDPKDSSRDALKTMLLGLDTVWLEAECSQYEFFGDRVAETHPDVGFIALDSDPEKALDLLEALAKSAPKCDLLVPSTS